MKISKYSVKHITDIENICDEWRLILLLKPEMYNLFQNKKPSYEYVYLMNKFLNIDFQKKNDLCLKYDDKKRSNKAYFTHWKYEIRKEHKIHFILNTPYKYAENSENEHYNNNLVKIDMNNTMLNKLDSIAFFIFINGLFQSYTDDFLDIKINNNDFPLKIISLKKIKNNQLENSKLTQSLEKIFFMVIENELAK